MMPLIDALTIKHAETGATITHCARMARDYVTSFYRARIEQEHFASIQTYCMFIGHARSGHSIVGAMLDAHPNVILPDEVDALRYVAAGFQREQIFHILLARSQRQAWKGRIKAGRNGKQYSYHVPDQWQGRFNKLTVIGDSKAGKSTQRFTRNPTLLDRLQNCMAGTDVKMVHVIRNPYDNISTMMVRGGRTRANAIAQYFANCNALAAVRGRIDSRNLLTVKQEQMILQPGDTLRALCRFLDIAAPDEYVRACTSILYTTVPKSRSSVSWDTASIEQIKHKIAEFDFLAGYTFDDESASQPSQLTAMQAASEPSVPIEGEGRG